MWVCSKIISSAQGESKTRTLVIAHISRKAAKENKNNQKLNVLGAFG
jgi:hypothetical protein